MSICFYALDAYEIEQEDPKQYRIESRGSKSFKGKVIKETTYDIKFLDEWQGTGLKDIKKDLDLMFRDVISRGAHDFDQNDLARLYINHPKLNHAIIVKPRPLQDLKSDVIMQAIENVLQSEEGLSVDEGFEVQLGVAKIVKGAGRTHMINVNQDRINKTSIVAINNTDNMCLARAIAVGLARLQLDEASDEKAKKTAKLRYDQLRKGNHTRHQKAKAREYHQLAGVPTDRPCTLNDVRAFEGALSIQVVVIAAHLGNKAIYQGTDADKRIYLYYTKEDQDIGHFDTIVNIKGLLARKYFCHLCLKGYDHKQKHSCAIACRVCHSDNCREEETKVCFQCNKTCRSEACFQRHNKICAKQWQCSICKHVLDISRRKPEQHTCGEWFCNSCEMFQLGEHLCYLRLREAKKPVKRFIFFDFETRQDDGDHIANYVVAQSACDLCDDTSTNCQQCGSRCSQCSTWDKKEKCFARLPCDDCGHREVIFTGDDTANKFGRWLFSKQHIGCTVMAHNANAFDNYFLIDYLTKNSIIPELIYNGSKIMYMNIKKLDVRVIDSLNFLPMKLAALQRHLDSMN